MMSGIVYEWLNTDALGKTGNWHRSSATQWEEGLRLGGCGKDCSVCTYGPQS